MSDLIGRIAARAVGAPALAQPRVAAPLAGRAALEIVDEEVVAPGVAPTPGTPESAPAVEAPAAAEPVVRATAEESANPLPSAEVPPTAASPGPAAEELPRHERHLPALDQASDVPSEAGLTAPTVEPRAAATAVPLSAVPAPLSSADTPAHRGAVAAHGYTGPTDSPPVRVHIGRLEVRASVLEQPAAPPPAQPSEPEGLSLSDYLRGKR